MTKYQYHAHFSTIPPPTLSCDILTIAKFPLQNVKIVKYKETDFAKLDCSKIIGALEKNAILKYVCTAVFIRLLNFKMKLDQILVTYYTSPAII